MKGSGEIKNEGKRFEEDFKSSINDNENWVYRLRDNAASFSGGTKTRFSSTNICDFLIFNNKYRTLYLVELKSTKGSSIPYTMIKDNQIKGLSEAGKHKVIPCFFFNYREKNNATYFMIIDDFLDMKCALDKKSFNPQDLEKYGAITVSRNIKRTRYRYDIETIIEQIHI